SGLVFFFQAEDGIRDATVTGVQTCALPISLDGRDQPPEIALGEEILRARLHRLDRDVLADRARDEDKGRVGITRSQQGEGRRAEIGRASCRERVEVGGVGGVVKTKRRYVLR